MMLESLRLLHPISSPWVVCLGSLALLFVAAAINLVGRIVYPTVIEFPWNADPGGASPTITSARTSSAASRKNSSARNLEQERDQEKTVVLAGSFNPIHKGHVSMLEYLATRYGRVIVAIGMNPDKVYPVTPHQRAALIETVLDHELSPYRAKIHVQVITGYIWRTVKRRNASVFFRGIRSWKQDGSEERKLQILNTWGPLLYGPLWWPIPTVFLIGDPQYAHISSTLIRDICHSRTGAADGEPDQMGVEALLQSLVPSSIARSVMHLYGEPRLKA